MTIHKKIVVFDMDETLGYFTQLGLIYDSLAKSGVTMTQEVFNELMDLFPKFLRPNIMNVLEYVSQKKRSGDCSNVYIYTNNQGPKSLGKHIKEYFETKLGYKLFDDLVGAYKIRGILNDGRRTSNKKTYDDIKTITNVSDNTQICFLDDQYHENMIHPNIYYIYLPEFVYNYSVASIISKIDMIPGITNDKMKQIAEYIKYGLENDRYYKRKNTKMSKALDVTDETIHYLKTFFKKSTQHKTKKNRRKRNNKTKRNR